VWCGVWGLRFDEEGRGKGMEGRGRE